MSGDPVTPELRQWILAQSAVGQPAEALLKGMLASGWSEPAARQALRVTLQADLAANAEMADAAAGVTATLAPTGVPVPEPLAEAGSVTLQLADREVDVLVAMQSPRIVVVGGLLAGDECDELIELARERLSRSETVQTDTGSNEVNAARTSDGMFFERGEFALCKRIETRMAALMRWPVESGEGLQILRYGVGAEYRPHHDYFDPAQAGTPALLQRGGQRVASLICYLNTPRRGGSTVFPDIGLEVAPVKGNAVFFSYDRPDPGTRTLHGGGAVLEGEKWVATKWVRERRFE
ncbi:MAG: 2OG-Fe(II) oxygenase [Pseudomonadota bacterium]|nr:2OG-Fe(II) oxygenase [Pseudomonadota bacterium]